jgi:hypothetical protein
MKKLILLLALPLAACGSKKQPETVPQPKAGAPETAAAPAVSTPTAGADLLHAPGNYLKTTVGHINEAKAAKALFEKTAKEEASSADLNNTGGN